MWREGPQRGRRQRGGALRTAWGSEHLRGCRHPGGIWHPGALWHPGGYGQRELGGCRVAPPDPARPRRAQSVLALAVHAVRQVKHFLFVYSSLFCPVGCSSIIVFRAPTYWGLPKSLTLESRNYHSLYRKKISRFFWYSYGIAWAHSLQ